MNCCSTTLQVLSLSLCQSSLISLLSSTWFLLVCRFHFSLPPEKRVRGLRAGWIMCARPVAKQRGGEIDDERTTMNCLHFQSLFFSSCCSLLFGPAAATNNNNTRTSQGLFFVLLSKLLDWSRLVNSFGSSFTSDEKSIFASQKKPSKKNYAIDFLSKSRPSWVANFNSRRVVRPFSSRMCDTTTTR